MRILLATPWVAPHGGGLERYAATIAAQLRRAGHEVTLLGHALEPREEDGLVAVAPARTLSNTPLSLEVWRAAKRLAPLHDVVNVHTPVPGTAELVALAARRARVPYVVTYHAGTLAGPAGLLSLAARAHAATAERWMLRGASGRIAVSPYVAEHVFRGLPSEVIPPGVDAQRFRASAEPVRGRVLFVGPVSRAYAWKGFATLADAFAILSERVPEAHLRAVGEGDLVERYRARFAGKPVAFVGRVDDETLVREYSRASVVVLPSISAAESFGMCLAEANACARPVVGSAVGGIPAFVRHGENGLLATPGDPRALADALATVLTQPTLARDMGLAGRARVEKEHAWGDLAQRTLAVYERALTAFTAASARGSRRSAASRSPTSAR